MNPPQTRLREVSSGILFLHTVLAVAAMNSPLLPEVIRRLEDTPQSDLPLETEGVLRYVWENRFGEMLIEVIDGIVYVNGDRVEPAMAEGGMAQALR